MGRIRLRRFLTLGLVLILFLSLLASALGVAVLVRKYLWNRSREEIKLLSLPVTRFLENFGQRPNVANQRPQGRQLERNLRRFNRGPSRVILFKDGRIVEGPEESELEWIPRAEELRPGLWEIEAEGQSWQVYTQRVKSELADQFVVIRPWSPSVRVVRTLVLYQILASIVVMGLALGAVSYFARRLARPLEELREKTVQVGSVAVESLLPSGILEISELQTSFVDMSKRVDETMSSQRRFVADASHELKTPLTAISGMLELLQSHPGMEEEDRHKALQVAKKEADRMESLISDLLLLSRAQAKSSGSKSEVVLADLVGEQLTTLQLLFPAQKFLLEGDTDSSWFMNSDAFARVARNLIENACHYGGGEPIHLRFTKTKSGVEFAVKDSGPGIPPDKLDKLFERFYRTDSGRARTEGGHGLGLAIVEALVEEVGGELSCVSELGKGAEFRAFFRKS